jgi:CubicO group peptidase (beta-lactamase class C family)
VLVAKNGKPIYQRPFGLAERSFDVPNRVDTKFNLGSINKLFTAVAIAQLIEAGKISLEDPLHKFIPDFVDEASGKKIRIKHLLSHTSGLGTYFSDEFFRTNPGRFRNVADYMEYGRRTAKMEFEPGSRWSYSNTGMLVLGRIIEIVSGMDYYDYIQKNIYDRVGMKDTGSFATDAVVKNRATGYEMDFGENGQTLRNGVLLTSAVGSPAGGGFSTAPDLLRLANTLQAGKLIKPETLQLFSMPKPELNSPEYGYGFTIAFRGPRGRDATGHVGDFSDGTCASFEMIRDAGPYTAVVLSNGTAAGTCHPITEFINRMFPARAK